MEIYPPSEVYAWNVIVFPFLLLSIRWAQPQLSRVVIFIMSAPLSWVLANSLLWIDPPENGAAYEVNLLFGWDLLIPLCALLFAFEWIAFKTLGVKGYSPAFVDWVELEAAS